MTVNRPTQAINTFSLAYPNGIKPVEDNVVYNPPCKLAKSVKFDPVCPYSGEASCKECISDEVQAAYLTMLLVLHKYLTVKD